MHKNQIAPRYRANNCQVMRESTKTAAIRATIFTHRRQMKTTPTMVIFRSNVLE